MAAATFTVTNVSGEGAEQSKVHITGSGSASASKVVAMVSVVIVVIAAILAWLVYHSWVKPIPIRIATGYVPFAGIVVVSAALERLLEPFTLLFPSTDDQTQTAATAKEAAQQVAADPAQSADDAQSSANNAAKEQAQVAATRTDRAIAIWAIASVCGLALSSIFGFLLLQSVAVSGTHVNSFLDLVVTGLAIGAGTKPLHDLITSLSSNSNSSGDST